MKKKLHIIIVMVLVLLISFQTVSAAVDIPQKGDDLRGTTVIIHVNDVHGHVDDNMGYSSVKALKEHYLEAGAEVIMLDAGDTFHGMPAATLNEGEDIVPMLDEVGFDAMAPGNHDFNYGWERLKDLTGSLNHLMLAANVTRDDGSAFTRDNIILSRNGRKFGIFGLTTPETAYQTDPENVEGLTFADPVQAAKEQVEKLQAEDVDYIIALTHIGVDPSSEVTADKIAAEVPGIDIIVDGHSHTQLEEGVSLDPNITLQPHGDTVIAQTGAYIENIGVITINEAGEIKAELVNADMFGEKDPDVDEVVGDIKDEQSPLLKEVVGTTPVDLDGERENVRTKETNLGDLTADVMLDVSGADIALMNGGSIRASIPAGDITREEIITVYPFGNYIKTKEITGEAIVAALELSVSGYPNETGGFLQIAGAEFAFDPEQPEGDRVVSVEIGGKELSNDQKYIVASNDYVFSGGDNYTMFTDFADVGVFSALDEAVTAYITENQDKIPAEPQGRIHMEGEAGEAQASAEAEESGSAADDTADTAEAAADDEGQDSSGETEKAEEIAASVDEGGTAETTVTGGGSYTVVKGDCLWDIAAEQLGDAYRWPEIYEMNTDQIANPDLIDIGWVLVMPAA